MASRKLVQYGAGNIGRSLVGQLFSAAGWEVVFIDVAPDIIAALNREHRYRVVVKEETPAEIWVEGVRGIGGNELDQVVEEISTCDLLSTALGASILPRVAPLVCEGLIKRKRPLDVLLCENLRGAATIMHEAIAECLPEGYDLNGKAGFVATSIGKMVPLMPPEIRKQDPLEVWAEAYNAIVADGEAFVGEVPDVPGLIVKKNFEAYVDQKLFVHNMGHAVAAYMGDRFGDRTIAESMDREEVAAATRGAMKNSGDALVQIYPEEFNTAGMDAHIDDLCRRFRNHALGDTVYRVGRDRPRKYAANDRFMGSLKAQRIAATDSTQTLEGMAAGLFFSATEDDGSRLQADVDFEEILRRWGVEGLMQEVCGMNPHREWDHEIIDRIRSAAQRWKPKR